MFFQRFGCVEGHSGTASRIGGDEHLRKIIACLASQPNRKMSCLYKLSISAIHCCDQEIKSQSRRPILCVQVMRIHDTKSGLPRLQLWKPKQLGVWPHLLHESKPSMMLVPNIKVTPATVSLSETHLVAKRKQFLHQNERRWSRTNDGDVFLLSRITSGSWRNIRRVQLISHFESQQFQSACTWFSS